METAVITSQRAERVYKLMKITYGVVPIVAGLDKFTNLLTDWEKYLHPGIAQMLPFSPHTFMVIVGVIEIVAGLIVLARPAIGAYIVMAWLALIALTLIAQKGYLDVAVRDLVMAIGAYSLAQLARTHNTSMVQKDANRGASLARG
jgi:uncharacterized membrane protein YphA (DoxX/SURF4 family)